MIKVENTLDCYISCFRFIWCKYVLSYLPFFMHILIDLHV